MLNRSHLIIDMTKSQAEKLFPELQEFMEKGTVGGNILQLRESWMKAGSKTPDGKREMLSESFLIWLQYSMLKALS